MAFLSKSVFTSHTVVMMCYRKKLEFLPLKREKLHELEFVWLIWNINPGSTPTLSLDFVWREVHNPPAFGAGYREDMLALFVY